MAQQGAIFLVINYIGSKKDRRLFNHLKLSDFEVKNNAFIKVNSNVTTGGSIKFELNEYGLNCGQYLENYIAKIAPDCPWLFPSPVRKFGLKQSFWYYSPKRPLSLFNTHLLTEVLSLPKYVLSEIPMSEEIERTINENPCYTCPMCDKRFNKSFNLNRHLVTHSSEYPFACQFCDKRYREKQTLTKHIKKVHSNKT